jgi:DNA polymerase epsilon subunit 2
VSLLEEILAEHDIEPDQVQNALEAIAKECQKQEGELRHVSAREDPLIPWFSDCSTIITCAILQRVYDFMREAGEDGTTTLNPLEADSLDPDHHLFIFDAFDMPNWQYSPERKTFERYLKHFDMESLSNETIRPPNKSTIAGSATSRATLLRNRHNVIKQLVLRNEHFSPPISGRDRANYLKVGHLYFSVASCIETQHECQITSSKDLLGRSGERFLLFGMLSHMSDGKLCIEDVDGKVPLDISETVPSRRFIFHSAGLT